MNRIIAVTNHKGGVGKTTSAVNLAAAFAEMGKRVLLIDLDPQGHATTHLGVRSNGMELLQAMQGTVGLPVTATRIKGLELVPAGPSLAATRQRFSEVMGAELLARSFARTQGDWDMVLIDCPPSLDVLTLNALRLSHHVVIPVEVNRFAVTSLDQMKETLASARAQNPSLTVRSLIPCRAHPRRRLHNEILTELEKLMPGKVAPIVRENVALAEAAGKGLPVLTYAPRSHGTSDYRAVTSWLADRLFGK